jgi:hypothetical protein
MSKDAPSSTFRSSDHNFFRPLHWRYVAARILAGQDDAAIGAQAACGGAEAHQPRKSAEVVI